MADATFLALRGRTRILGRAHGSSRLLARLLEREQRCDAQLSRYGRALGPVPEERPVAVLARRGWTGRETRRRWSGFTSFSVAPGTRETDAEPLWPR